MIFEPCIKYKIDWWTIIFNNVSPNEVFDALGIDHFRNEEVIKAFNERYLKSAGYELDFTIKFQFGHMTLHYHDILISLQSYSLDNIDQITFFDTVFPYIRFDLSGECLDTLRCRDIEVDSIAFKPLIMPDRKEAAYHYTRCDYAFDLLNYCPEFVDQLMLQVRELRDPETYRVFNGKYSGLKAQIHDGCDSRTVYLGSKGGQKLLRVYDKRFQYRNKLSEIPYYILEDGQKIYPFSWIRIELQTRKATAESVCQTSGGDFMQIFRYIFDNFALTTGRRSKEISVLWLNLFNWSTIKPIIQNANFV